MLSRRTRTKRGPRRGRPPGRAPTPTDILRRRGASSVRKKQPKNWLIPERDPGPPPAIPKNAAGWTRLLRELPRFDPFREAAGFWFDRAAAHAAITFFHKQLKHFKGDVAGMPFYLERWQMAIVANVWGWRDETGARRFRYVFILAGRKNGKTPFAAGLCLLMTFLDREAGAEIYSAGCEYKQAAKVWDYAAGMLTQNAKLLARATIYRGYNQRAIQLGPETGSTTFRPIASDANAAYCFNTYGAIIDELFTQPDRQLVEALETSTANRRSPLVVYLTTADFERDSICNEKHDYALSVCEDGGDPHFLPALFYADDDDDITKRATWRKANPNLGVSVSERFFRIETKRAKRDPAYRNTFRRVHLCIRTSATERAIPGDAWKQCAKRYTAEDLKGRRCYGGLDLGATSATNALVLLFPVCGAMKPSYRALAWFWVPEALIRRQEERGKAQYRRWMLSGHLRATRGMTADYATIRRDIVEIGSEHLIEDLAVDRLFQGAQLCADLKDDGFNVIAFGQGFYSMAAPTRDFCDLVLDGRFWHPGHPVLNSHAANTAVELDAAGNMKPTRKATYAPIDGIVSAIMALGRASQRPWEPLGESRTPGVRTI